MTPLSGTAKMEHVYVAPRLLEAMRDLTVYEQDHDSQETMKDHIELALAWYIASRARARKLAAFPKRKRELNRGFPKGAKKR